jgi:hypothetical protein
MRPTADHPRIGHGWFVGYVDGVLVVHSRHELSAADFALYLAMLAEEIDSADPALRTAVLYDIAKGGSTDAPRRKLLGDVLKARRAKLTQILAGCAVATASPITRGIATALMWITSPPCEVRFVATPQEAFTWFAAMLPGVDADGSQRRYEALKQHCERNPAFQ